VAGSSATTLKSIQNLRKHLSNFLKAVETEPSKILAEEAPKIEREAKAMTPYKSGKLENSVKVRVSRSKVRPGLTVSASAKSKGYNYAALQHEVKFNHPIKGRDHYLSIPFEKGIKRIKAKILKRVTYKGGK
jgi:hypothetical protein